MQIFYESPPMLIGRTHQFEWRVIVTNRASFLGAASRNTNGVHRGSVPGMAHGNGQRTTITPITGCRWASENSGSAINRRWAVPQDRGPPQLVL